GIGDHPAPHPGCGARGDPRARPLAARRGGGSAARHGGPVPPVAPRLIMDDWRAALAGKLVGAEEAVARVRSGDLVRFPLGRVPRTLAAALAGRRDELRDVRVLQGATAYPLAWATDTPGWDEHIAYVTDYITPLVRPCLDARHGVFRARGDASVPLADFDLVVESREEPLNLPAAYPEPGPERREVTDAVGAAVASLVNDRDTIQIGTGTLSALMGSYLAHKLDLGVDSEILVPSVIELVKCRAATGRYKTY